MKENKMRNWMNWIVAFGMCTMLSVGSFGCGDSRVIYAGAECESNSDCALGLECFRGECSYPCRGALMCPVDMDGNRLPCNTATGYCEGDPMTECRPDICDGLDNDCDTETDEGSVCQPCNLGEEIACATGMDGICGEGVQRCLGDRSGFGPCSPRRFGDSPEICDNRIDDNCDGRPDENCACDSELPIHCMIPGFFGACAEGQMFCLSDGTGYGPCQPLHFPSGEICNGFDDNCDGRIDEELLNACGSCGVVTPEYCDGSDNDCDGSIDEDCECVDEDGRVCGTDVGACTTGVQYCMGGHWGLCLSVSPASETCNGADDDCDTTIDEDCECRAGETRSCGETMGACTTGSQFCIGGFWSTCSGIAPDTEVCDLLMADEDCDGTANETCSCVEDDIQP
ncbi:MAG: MopE-related protein, partial [Patescibacteria group bacterium]